MSPDNQNCGPEQCPPANDEWALPAGILNIIWGDIIPRLRATRWLLGPGNGVYPGMTKEQFIAALHPSQLPQAANSPHFNARVKLVRQYLKQACSVPIFFPAEDAFDFLLSDQGLEIFLPKKPQDEAFLYHQYSYRRTGQGPIGIPEYLVGGISALLAEARRGPSQIALDPDHVFEMAAQAGCGEDSETFQCIRKKLEQLRHAEAIVREEPAAAPEAPVAASEFEEREAMSSAREDLDVPFEPGDEKDREELLLIGGPTEYACLTSLFRCWQMEGAVTQAIFTEMPRVVATSWVQGNTGDYTLRFADGGDTGLRAILEERLEVTVPDADQMRFETYAAPNSFPACWGPKDNSANGIGVQDDIVITNRGFFFPERPAPPTMNTILTAIREGRASNPVFTDTRRPLRF